MDERVNAFYGMDGAQCRQTGCRAVADLVVVSVQPLPLVQFHADNAQQVVTEEFAVLLLDDKRNITVRLGLCQHFGMLHGLPVVLAALGFPFLVERLQRLANRCQRYIVNGLQCQVLRGLLTLLQALDGRHQRVRSYFSLQLGMQQYCLQPLSVGVRSDRRCCCDLFGSLLLYLLQMRHGGLRKVFLLRLLHSLPERLIGLS